jgi:hypothetical protein
MLMDTSKKAAPLKELKKLSGKDKCPAHQKLKRSPLDEDAKLLFNAYYTRRNEFTITRQYITGDTFCAVQQFFEKLKDTELDCEQIMVKFDKHVFIFNLK